MIFELELTPAWPDEWDKEKRERGAKAIASHFTNGKVVLDHRTVQVDAITCQAPGAHDGPQDRLIITITT